MAGPVCALCQESILDTEPRSTYHAIVAYLYKPVENGQVCKDTLNGVSFRGKVWDPSTAPPNDEESQRLPIHNRCQAVIRRAAKRMGIEPPGGGRGKSKRQTDRDAAPAARAAPGAPAAPRRTGAEPPPAATGGRKRPASEMNAPAPGGAAGGSATGSMLQYILHAFSACAMVVEERSTDSKLLYNSMVARTAKSARTNPDLATAAAAAQATRVRASVVKSVAKAAAQLQATAQLLGQVMGTQMNLPTPAMPPDVAAYLAQVLETRRSSALPSAPQRPAGSYGLPLGHSAAGASSAPLNLHSSTVRAPSRVSSMGTPALPAAVDRPTGGKGGNNGLRSPNAEYVAPMRSHTGAASHPSRVSVATGYTSRVGAGGAGGGSDNALSHFASVAAEAWERESAASGLSSTPNAAAAAGGAERSGGGGRRSRRSMGGGSSSAGRASADAGAASGSAGRASAVLLRSGAGGHATPLSPSPADVADGDSEVAAMSGVLSDSADRRRRRADSTGDEGNVSDADSTRAAPAIAAPAIRSALDVSFAADDDDDRFDPFDFIDAADLGSSMRKAAGADRRDGRPPPIRAPAAVAAERRGGGSPVMFGMVGAANFAAPLKGGTGGLEEAPSGMLPHQVSGPMTHAAGLLGTATVSGDAGLVGAATGPMPRAGSALSSVGHSTTIGRMRHPLLVGGNMSIASSGGAPRGGVFPSPVPPPSRQRSNSAASSSAPGDLLLGGEVMGLRPLDSVSAAPSPAGRETASARGGPLGTRGSEAATSPVKGGHNGGGSVEGPYGYSAWGAGVFGNAPPLTPLALPHVGDSAVQGMLSANGSSTGGTSASATGARGQGVRSIAVQPGGVVSVAEGGGDMEGPGTGFTSGAGAVDATWQVVDTERGGAAQLHGDAVDSREW